MKETTCASCREPYPLDQLIEFEGEFYCASCLGNETVICSRCGERIWDSDNSGTEDVPLCQSCYDDHYTSCISCGRLIRTEDAYYDDYENDDPYCHECHMQRDGRSIHDYYYKPMPILYGDGKRYFGVELEVDNAGEDDDSADAVRSIANPCEPNSARRYADGTGCLHCTHPLLL